MVVDDGGEFDGLVDWVDLCVDVLYFGGVLLVGFVDEDLEMLLGFELC